MQPTSRTHFVAALALALTVCGCVSPTPPRSDDVAVREALVASLGSLPEVSDDAANALASLALDTTADLHAAYRPNRWPKLGNLAFHLGLRERALCCHWTRDLLHALSALELEDIELRWGVAHHGDVFREHSAVVVVPRDARFEEGLVLDAWRNAGHLHFTRVFDDRYPWRPHPGDANRLRIQCRSGRGRGVPDR